MVVETTRTPTSSPPPQPAEVLLIDANEEHQMLSALALGRKGFRVTAATSARDGIFVALTKPFDAIILDHKIRDPPAMEVLETLVERLPAVPKIFVVAPGAEALAAKALGLGATGYLVKTAMYNEVLPAEVEDQIRKAATEAQVQGQRKALAAGVLERQKVESALRETEERLHLLLERAPFVLWTVDPRLTVTSSLGSGLSSLGLESNETIGKPLADLFPGVPADNPFFEAHRRALAGVPSWFEEEWQRRIYDIHVGPLRQRGGPVLGAFGVALDVTTRVRAERVQKALHRVAQAVHDTDNLKDLFRSVHAILGELMPTKNIYVATVSEPDLLEFPYFVDERESPPGPQRMGRGLTEYVLRTGRALLASPDVFRALMDSGEVVEIGPPSIDWLGVPLKVKDRVIGVLVVQSYTEGVRYREEDRDLLQFVSAQIALAIERKRAEDALHEQERFLNTLVSNLPGVAYRCKNEPDWPDEYVSEGVRDLLGYAPGDVVTMNWGELIHPDDRESVWRQVQEAVKAKKPFRLTYRIRTRDGHTKWVWEQGRGVYSDTGELVALEGFITDVSPGRADG